MQGTVALAVQAVRVRPLGIVLRLDGRRLVELRILPEQGVRLLGPGLVAQQVDLRHEADAPEAAHVDDPLHVLLRQRVLVPQFGMGLIGVIPVHPQDEQVEMGRDQVPLDELQEIVHPAGLGRLDGEAPDGQEFVDGFRRGGEEGGEDRQGQKERSFHHAFDLIYKNSTFFGIAVFGGPSAYRSKGFPPEAQLTTQRRALTNRRFCVASEKHSSPWPILMYTIR